MPAVIAGALISGLTGSYVAAGFAGAVIGAATTKGSGKDKLKGALLGALGGVTGAYAVTSFSSAATGATMSGASSTGATAAGLKAAATPLSTYATISAAAAPGPVPLSTEVPMPDKPDRASLKRTRRIYGGAEPGQLSGSTPTLAGVFGA